MSTGAERIAQLEQVVCTIYRKVIEMNSQVSNLVIQVAATVAEEGKIVTAIGTLKSQITALQAQLATAISEGFTPDDVAALTKAVSDLNASAATLASA